MKWKFYIPSEWKPNERQTWEDVWVMPTEQNNTGKSIWLTIESLTSAGEFGDERSFESIAKKLEAQKFYIDGADVFVNTKDFSRAEIIDWIQIWLQESGFVVSELIEGTFEEFENTNADAIAISEATAERRNLEIKGA